MEKRKGKTLEKYISEWGSLHNMTMFKYVSLGQYEGSFTHLDCHILTAFIYDYDYDYDYDYFIILWFD